MVIVVLLINLTNSLLFIYSSDECLLVVSGGSGTQGPLIYYLF